MSNNTSLSLASWRTDRWIELGEIVQNILTSFSSTSTYLLIAASCFQILQLWATLNWLCQISQCVGIPGIFVCQPTWD